MILRTLCGIKTPMGTAVGTLTMPVNPSAPSGLGIVLVPPLGTERTASDRMLQSLATLFANDGHATVLVDPVGTGDADDLADEVGIVSSYGEAIRAAKEMLREHGIARVLGIGLRFGGLVLGGIDGGPSEPPNEKFQLDAAILWSPIEKGRNYRRELLMLSASTNDGVSEGQIAPGGTVLRPLDLEEIGKLALSRNVAPAPHTLVLAHPEKSFDSDVAHAWSELCHLDLLVDDGLDHADLTDPEQGQVPTETLQKLALWANTHRLDSTTSFELSPPSLAIQSDTWTEDVCRVSLRDGYLLHAIRTAPVGKPPANIGLVLLATGTNPRFGPARLHVRIARQLAAAGFAVLRVERRGADLMPDSVDAYDPVHIADTGDCAEQAQGLLGVEAIALGGICSGAWAVWHAALEGLPIASAISINQIIFGDDSWDHSDASPAIAVRTRQAMRDRDRWREVLSGKVNVGRSVKRIAQYGALVVKNKLGSLHGLTGDLARIDQHGTSLRFLFDTEETGLVYLRMHGHDALTSLQRKGSVHIAEIRGAGHVFAPPRAAEWLINSLLTECQRLSQ